jgi:hypothetical protein
LENAKKNLVFHFGGGRHASFPQKPVVKLFFILVLPQKVLGCAFESKKWKLSFFESPGKTVVLAVLSLVAALVFKLFSHLISATLVAFSDKMTKLIRRKHQA